MNDKIREFQEKGYTHLNGFLDLENCQQLTEQLKSLVDAGITVQDEQCPISQAIHGAPVFDSLLEQLLPHFEQASGKKLFPTYAYARLYKKGETLKIHTDRPACEISATLTLGFEGEQWAIYMADDENKTNQSEIKMNVGDAVLYKGTEKFHWRNEFNGDWQAQVFLHYVDAEGEYANLKYDGRKSLSHHTETANLLYYSFDDAFTLDACNKIIEGCEKIKGEQASIGISGLEVNKLVRDVKKTPLPLHRGIGATLTGMAIFANSQLWNFDVNCANQADFLHYDKEGHYLEHLDTFLSTNSKECRKLTVLAFLNDDFKGGKLFLKIGANKIYPPQYAGTVLVFPSFLLHGVEPVISGTRRTIVTWLVGNWFK